MRVMIYLLMALYYLCTIPVLEIEELLLYEIVILLPCSIHSLILLPGQYLPTVV